MIMATSESGWPKPVRPKSMNMQPPECRKQGGTGLGQRALRRLLSAPDRALSCPMLRPASANRPLGPRECWPQSRPCFRHTRPPSKCSPKNTFSRCASPWHSVSGGRTLGGGLGVELGLIRESNCMSFQVPRSICLTPKKMSVSRNLGPGSFERFFRGGFNGNNGAFQYPNPDIYI